MPLGYPNILQNAISEPWLFAKNLTDRITEKHLKNYLRARRTKKKGQTSINRRICIMWRPSMHLVDSCTALMVVEVDINTQLVWFGALTHRFWSPRLSSHPSKWCMISTQTSIKCRICIMWRPSMHLVDSCTALMVVGVDINTQFSWFGAHT